MKTWLLNLISAEHDPLTGRLDTPQWILLAALAVAPLVAGLAADLLAPSLAVAQTAGCGGQAIIIQNLDNLLQTAWDYLTGGAVIRILAAAFFIFGVGSLIGRRPGAAIVGILAGAITAFVPNILNTLFTSGKAAISLCG